VSFHVLDVVQFRCKGVLNVNYDDFPVGFTLVEECHDTKNLNLLDLTNVADLLADLADIERVIVALGFRFCVRLSRVLPCLYM